VWSITCLYVDRHHRNQGLSVALLKEAVKHARRHGARVVEGYPVQPDKRLPGGVLYTGTVSAFTKAGFKEVARRLPARPIVRRQFSGAI
jgi:GNAT superfamily N-acetyltransferase